MRTTEYTRDELNREARNAVKGRGRLLHWTIFLATTENSGVTYPSIKVYYFSKELQAEQATHVSI